MKTEGEESLQNPKAHETSLIVLRNTMVSLNPGCSVTTVRCSLGVADAFQVKLKFGLQRGCALSHSLFDIIMNRLNDSSMAHDVC